MTIEKSNLEGESFALLTEQIRLLGEKNPAGGVEAAMRLHVLTVALGRVDTACAVWAQDVQARAEHRAGMLQLEARRLELEEAHRAASASSSPRPGREDHRVNRRI